MTKALVLLSGGLSSTVSLFDAINRYEDVEALTFFYGQRNPEEVAAARDICRMSGVKWKMGNLLGYGELLGVSLTEEQIAVRERYPVRGVSEQAPASHLTFLLLAGSYAYTKGVTTLVTGLRRTGKTVRDMMDFGDVENILYRNYRVLVDHQLQINTKSEDLKLGKELSGSWEALRKSVTCLNGKIPGCGQCQPCILRLRAVQEAGVGDPHG